MKISRAVICGLVLTVMACKTNSMLPSAHAADEGLGSLLAGRILQSGPTPPLTNDLVKLYRGQNGDAIYSYQWMVPAYTIAGLPTCNAAATGFLAYVSNGATTPTYNLAVTTAGSTPQLVWCNGTGWTYH